MKNQIEFVDVLLISNWKWKQVKTAYRKYVKNKYSENFLSSKKLWPNWHFSSVDNICASLYLNHFNDNFNVPKFNKLHVALNLDYQLVILQCHSKQIKTKPKPTGSSVGVLL